MFNMLIVQQVPSAFSECLITNSEINAIAIKGPSKQILQHISMDAIAGLAVMVHTEGKQWRLPVATPLESVFIGDSHGIDFEGISERTMLRQRICRLIAEKLIEGVDNRLQAVLDLLEAHTVEINGVKDNQLLIVQAILQILAHTVSSDGNPGVEVCSCIVNYNRTISILFDIIRSSSHHNSSIKGLSTIILKSIVKRMALPFHHIETSIKILFDNILNLNIKGSPSNVALVSLAMSYFGVLLSSSLSSSTLMDEDLNVVLSNDEQMTINNQIIRFFTSSKSISLITSIIINPNSNSDTDRIMGSELGYPLGYELDGVLDLLVCLCTSSNVFVDKIIATINHSSTGDDSDKEGGASLPAIVCRLLQSKGKHLFSPLGVTSSIKFISILLSANNTTNDDDDNNNNANGNNTTSKSNRSKDILMFARIEGLVGLLALVCLPQHLELVSMWTLVTHTNTNTNEDNERGGLVDDLAAASSSILRSLTVVLASETTGKESQLLLESMHKTQMIKTLILALKVILTLNNNINTNTNTNTNLKAFGASLSEGSLASIIYVLSELVLTSSKFMTQFSEAQGLEVIDELPCEVFSNYDTNSNNTEDSSRIEYRLSSLQIASHMARHSEKHYPLLSSVFSPAKLVSLVFFIIIIIIIIINYHYYHYNYHHYYYYDSFYIPIIK